MKYYALLVLCMLFSLPVVAADYYVDNTVGNDTFDGVSKTVTGANSGPFRTITRAANAANPGDTVH
ncbi:MAG TPA: hypothetical protein VGL77_18525, partial [Armatimonadota bacterium]